MLLEMIDIKSAGSRISGFPPVRAWGASLQTRTKAKFLAFSSDIFLREKNDGSRIWTSDTRIMIPK